jgi:xylan 1,4-beta-xylosidase
MYPAKYIQQIPMTDMTLRPSNSSPGRTYRWFNESILPFGYGLHYTNFSASFSGSSSSQSRALNHGASFDLSSVSQSCNETYLAKCPFASVPITVSNTGDTTSDYSALLFLSGEFGPAPHPLKTLVSYKRMHSIAAGTSQTATLHLTLNSIARVDETGCKVVYPGTYELMLDTPTALASMTFELTGEQRTIEEFPQPPKERSGRSTDEVGDDYFVGGYEGAPQHVMENH